MPTELGPPESSATQREKHVPAPPTPENCARKGNKESESYPWTETPIAGFPALAYRVGRSTSECSASVQITDERMQIVDIQGHDLTGTGDRCGSLAQMAEAETTSFATSAAAS
ncbi:hypothetical protein [Amycolatopsis sp. NPDC051903]|uniref:hypothetical protein n=1 Tax=Amycolatopsis sp. NPDC051903 TaxID=3363936 RepID=UPI0037B231D0